MVMKVLLNMCSCDLSSMSASPFGRTQHHNDNVNIIGNVLRVYKNENIDHHTLIEQSSYLCRIYSNKAV